MQFHSYIFFSIDNMWYDLPESTRKTSQKELLDLLKKKTEIILYPYAILGLKRDMQIFFWLQSDTVEQIQDLLNDVLHTKLGKYLKIRHTLFGLTRPTQYAAASQAHLDTKRKGGKYLIIYPFTKTKDWYSLELEKRRVLMGGHIKIGKKYGEKITQLLLYSYGVDDSEFIVSYETDDLVEFQTLVMELRSDPVRAYTESDTPIFTGIYKPLEEILNYL